MKSFNSMVEFDLHDAAVSLSKEAEKAGRSRVFFPSMENGLSLLQESVLRAVADKGRISGSQLISGALAVCPEVHAAEIYKTACEMADRFWMRYPLLSCSVAVPPLPEPWENFFEVTYCGKSALPDSNGIVRLPSLFLNGFWGKSKFPPHRAEDFSAAVSLVAKNPGASVHELFEVLTGPDYPCGGSIFTSSSIYGGGSRGDIVSESCWEVLPVDGGFRITISSLPWGKAREPAVKRIAEKVRAAKHFRAVTDMTGSSVKIVIDAGKHADIETLIASLTDRKNGVLTSIIRPAFRVFSGKLGRVKDVSWIDLIRSYVAEYSELLDSPDGESGRRMALARIVAESVSQIEGPRACKCLLAQGGKDIIADVATVVTLTSRGMIKRTPPGAWKLQGRGGKGVGVAKSSDDDLVFASAARTVDPFLLVLPNGEVCSVKTDKIPDRAIDALGAPLHTVFPIAENEPIACVGSLPSKLNDWGSVVFVSYSGKAGRVAASSIAKMRGGRKHVYKAKDGDPVKAFAGCEEGDDVIFVSSGGAYARFPADRVPVRTGTCSPGVAFALPGGHSMAAVISGMPDCLMVLVKADGCGKKMRIRSLPQTPCGGAPSKCCAVEGDRDYIVVALAVTEDAEVLLATSAGRSIRIPVASIPKLGVDSPGSPLLTIDSSSLEIVTSATLIPAVGKSPQPDESAKPGEESSLNEPMEAIE